MWLSIATALRTRALCFQGEHRYEIGFTGVVSFAVTRARMFDAWILRQLNVLADFAKFWGIGHATTRGMGQTQRQ